MEKIKQFIEQFIQAEYQFTRMKYDILVSDEDCQTQAERNNNFYHTNNAPNDRRTRRCRRCDGALRNGYLITIK